MSDFDFRDVNFNFLCRVEKIFGKWPYVVDYVTVAIVFDIDDLKK